MDALLKMLGLDKEMVEAGGEKLKSVLAQLDRIENKQDIILDMLIREKELAEPLIFTGIKDDGNNN